MQPTGAAALPPAHDIEPHALHSMDWLFKREKIYLLAQFWQQVRTSWSCSIWMLRRFARFRLGLWVGDCVSVEERLEFWIFF